MTKRNSTGSLGGTSTGSGSADAASGSCSNDIPCILCNATSKFEDLAANFVHDLSQILLVPMFILFVTLVMLWVVVVAYKILMDPRKFADLFRQAFFIMLASLVLFDNYDLVVRVYEAGMAALAGASELAFRSVPGANLNNCEQGLARLMFAIEKNFIGTILQTTWRIIDSGSPLNPINWIYAIIFVVPFILILFLFFAKTVVAVFRMLLLAVLAPFLLLTFAFDWGRPMAVAGLKTFISAIIVLFAASAAVSITMYGIAGIALGSDDIDDFARVTNVDFLLAIILGWLGTALMTEGVAIANSITGSMLTNTAAGIITAGLAGSTAAVARTALTAAGGPVTKGADMARRKVSDLVDRYNGKGGGSPGGGLGGGGGSGGGGSSLPLPPSGGKP